MATSDGTAFEEGGLPDKRTAGDRPSLEQFGVLRHRGSWIALSPMQEDLMRVLVGCFGKPVSRTQLIASVWPGGGISLHAIDIHVHKLRPRLQSIGLVLHTLRGRGFMLESATD